MTENATIEDLTKFKNALAKDCAIIEDSLLNYEQGMAIEQLTFALKSSLRLQNLCKGEQLQSAKQLLDLFVDVLTLSIDNQIDLGNADINAILRGNDVLQIASQFPPEDIPDLFSEENVIVGEYTRELSRIKAPYRIKPKPKVSPKPSPDEAAKIKASTVPPKPVLIEKFKFGLAKWSDSFGNAFAELIKGHKPDPAIFENIEQLKTTALSLGLPNAAELVEASQLFMNIANGGIVDFRDADMKKLENLARFAKDISTASAMGIMDKFIENAEEIDDYISDLYQFLGNGDPVAIEAEVTQISPEQTTDDAVSIMDADVTEFIAEQTAPAPDQQALVPLETAEIDAFAKPLSRNNEFFDALLLNSTQVITGLHDVKYSLAEIATIKNELRELLFLNNSIMFNMSKTGTKKIPKIVSSIEEKINKIQKELQTHNSRNSEIISNLIEKSRTGYGMIFEKKSKPFYELTLGLKELGKSIANGLGKRVKIEIRNKALRIDSEQCAIIEAVMPHLLNHIITANIETEEERLAAGKQPFAKVRITAESVSGTLRIKFKDDGNGSDSAMQASDLKAIGEGLSLNSCALDIRAGRGIGTEIIISMSMIYSIFSSAVFEVAGDYYAVPINAVDGLIQVPALYLTNTAADTEEIRYVSVREIFGLKENVNLAELYPAIVVSGEKRQLALIFDKYIGNSELTAVLNNPALAEAKYIKGATVFNNRPVYVIDIEEVRRNMEELP